MLTDLLGQGGIINAVQDDAAARMLGYPSPEALVGLEMAFV